MDNKEFSKLLNSVVKEFLYRCTDDIAFTDKGPSPAFWRVRSYLLKFNRDDVLCLSQYLGNIPSKSKMTIPEALDNAKASMLSKREKIDKVAMKRAIPSLEIPYSIEDFM